MKDPWTPERINYLKELWNEGLSTREIGLKLGVTRNAVVGKAHRMGLSKRGSPTTEAPSTEDVEDLVRLETLSSWMCSWPDGDPGTPDFSFCGKPRLSNKPYCAEHCDRAYVRGGKQQGYHSRAQTRELAVKQTDPSGART